jgi:regulator of sirC expression with transglutaminase-like and TPR domain
LFQLLSDLLTNEGSAVQLDVAALEIATLEHPGLEFGPWIERLDRMAVEVANRTLDLCRGEAFIAAANKYLFDELKLRGDDSNYYDPRNSCINDVLERRVGIPITLSVIYIEIARRLAKPVFGIGLPGHFVVQYEDGVFSTFIDVYHGGELLTAEGCRAIVRSRAGMEIDARHFLPYSRKEIAVRMLRNLKGVYVRSQAFEKALRAMDLLIAAQPECAEEHKQRGMLNLQLERWRDAKADLETYLRLAPHSADAEEIRARANAIHRWLKSLN